MTTSQTSSIEVLGCADISSNKMMEILDKVAHDDGTQAIPPYYSFTYRRSHIIAIKWLQCGEKWLVATFIPKTKRKEITTKIRNLFLLADRPNEHVPFIDGIILSEEYYVLIFHENQPRFDNLFNPHCKRGNTLNLLIDACKEYVDKIERFTSV